MNESTKEYLKKYGLKIDYFTQEILHIGRQKKTTQEELESILGKNIAHYILEHVRVMSF